MSVLQIVIQHVPHVPTFQDLISVRVRRVTPAMGYFAQTLTSVLVPIIVTPTLIARTPLVLTRAHAVRVSLAMDFSAQM